MFGADMGKEAINRNPFIIGVPCGLVKNLTGNRLYISLTLSYS